VHEQSGDHEGNDNVWPDCSGGKNASPCNHDGNIADGIITAAQPNRADIGVTITVFQVLSD